MRAQTPANFCLYAVGDVHGRADLLLGLMHQIQAHAETLPPSVRAEVVMLGDYVDRGPQSAQVIDLLVTGFGPRLQVRCLRGNHEAMMMAAVQDPHCAMAERWLANGGVETLASYGLRADQVALLDQVLPDLHRRFLSDLANSHRRGHYLFAHAGVDPRRPMDQQKEEALIWIREPFLSHQGDYGVVVVHGHTIVDDAQQHHNRIAVDTGAFRSLRLTCAVLQDENVSFLQQTLPGVARPARWAVGG